MSSLAVVDAVAASGIAPTTMKAGLCCSLQLDGDPALPLVETGHEYRASPCCFHRGRADERTMPPPEELEL